MKKNTLLAKFNTVLAKFNTVLTKKITAEFSDNISYSVDSSLGRVPACQAGGPGSIPGRCSSIFGIWREVLGRNLYIHYVPVLGHNVYIAQFSVNFSYSVDSSLGRVPYFIPLQFMNVIFGLLPIN